MRVSDVIGGLAVGGLVVLVGLSLADDNSPVTIATSDTIALDQPAASTPSSTAPQTSSATTEPGSTDPEESSSTDATETTETTETTEGSGGTTPTSETSAGGSTTSSSTTTTTTTLVPPELRPLISIQVLNGGARAGRAGAATDLLEGEGFAPRSQRDASVGVETTTVLYAAGQEEEALTVNEYIGADAELVRLVEPDDPNWATYGTDLDVLVVLGPETP